MTMIGPAISELLRVHECVIVPGLGGFITSFYPADINESLNYFMPPRKTVAFNASLRTNDGILAHHLAGHYNISYSDALAQVNEWSQKALQQLADGQNLVIDKVGTLSLNTAGNIRFEPEPEMNFLDSSYGLPFFNMRAPGVEQPVAEEVASKQNIRKQIRHLIPSTLKWAAVLAPLIGFFIWGSMNTTPISNFVNNRSGLFAWSNSTPGKTAVTNQHTDNSTAVVFRTLSPAELLGEKALNYSPSAYLYEEMHRQNLSLTEATEVAKQEMQVAPEAGYYIVAGAFREANNATTLVNKLQQQGYPAAIVDTTKRGLYVVSIQSFSTKTEATEQLKNIRNSGHPSAWILKNS